MGLTIPENYVQTAIPIRYGGGGLYGYVTMGVYDFEETLTPVETLDVYVKAFVDNIGPYIDGGCTIGPGIGTVQLAGGSYATFTGTEDGVGGREDEQSSAPAVSVIVRKGTGRIGRTGRGRMFIPWLVDRESVYEDGSISSGAVTDITVALDAMGEQCTTNGVALFLLHNAGVPGGDTPTALTSLSVEPLVGTQRRRQRR